MKKGLLFGIIGFLLGAIIFSTTPVKAAIEEFICYQADYKLIINGEEYNDSDLPLLNYKGYTVGSVRKLFEAAGLDVNWDGELRQAEVNYTPKEEDEVSEEIENIPPVNNTPDTNGTTKPEPSSTDTPPEDITPFLPGNSDDDTGIPNPDHPR